MKTMLKFSFLLSAVLSVATSAVAFSPGEKVDNFRLLDADGKSHELYSLSGMKAVVLMVQGNGCPIVRQAVPALRDIRAQYRDKGVEFFLINSNLQDKSEEIAAEAKEFGFDIPVLVDGKQLVGESLGFTRTAEVLVIDPKTWKLAFRGPIDDRLSYEKQRLKATHEYTRDALDAVLAGNQVKDAQVNSAGCLINMPEQARRSKR